MLNHQAHDSSWTLFLSIPFHQFPDNLINELRVEDRGIRNASIALVRTDFGNVPVGRARRRWEKDISINFRQIDSEAGRWLEVVEEHVRS
jgi:hypothetical protein